MKAYYIALSLLSTLAAAQVAVESACQCPQVKCPSDDPVALCNCYNNRETLCEQRCPDYLPTYLPCPAKPPVPKSTSTPSGHVTTTTPTPRPSCVCEEVFCIQIWPGGCYCANNAKVNCYQKCGGPKPSLQSCPPTTIVALPSPTKTPTPTTSKAPLPPAKTNPVCGGGRSNYLTCASGYTCIQDVSKPGCGPACDGLGICVEEKMCGGFAGTKCANRAKVCIDDPRDDCDPEDGGADCDGLCAWPAVM